MLRATLKRLARCAGHTVVSRRHVAVPYLEHPPRNVLDQVLLRCHPVLQGLNFIQAGANDGTRADPIARYLDPCSWSGLMFEPLAANFDALRRHHGANPRLRLRQQAIDTVAGSRPLYDLDRAAHPELPDWAHGLASFSRDRVLQAARELGLDERALVTETVTAVTWDEVWRDFGPQRCDLLVLDTEGYDLTLLRAANLAERRPRIIHFEHACTPPADRLAFYGELLALGYEIATDGSDTTAWLAA